MKAMMFNDRCWITSESLANNPSSLKEYFEDILKRSGFGIISFVEHHFEPHGYTCLWLLSESHLAIHTFPEENKIYIQENLELDVLFKEYLSLRKKKRYSMSDTVVKRLLTKLKKFSDNGHNPFDVIGNAINSSWKDFYEPKTKPVSFQEQERQKTAQLGKIMSAGFDPFNQEHWDKINNIDNQGVIDAAIEH